MKRDLRAYARQTNIRLFFGFLLLALLVGDGMIYLFYGRAAAVSGLLCILAGLAPLVLIWFGFLVMDYVIKRANQED